MAIRFTISKRGLLPTEKKGAGQDASSLSSEETTILAAAKQHLTDAQWLKSLRPQLESRQTVNVLEFQDSASRLPSLLPTGELSSALYLFHEVIMHELRKGNAVLLPGIGTFRLTLKGGIEVRESHGEYYYHGKDVHVGSIQFEPDRSLLKKARAIKVNQSPYGMTFHVDDEDVQKRLDELFASKDSITHKDVLYAFEGTLTRSRVTSLLQRLVREGSLVMVGQRSQTRYRRKER